MIVIFVFNSLLKISSNIVLCDFTIQNVFQKIDLKKKKHNLLSHLIILFGIYITFTKLPQNVQSPHI